MPESARPKRRLSRFFVVLAAFVGLVACAAIGIVVWSRAETSSLRKEFQTRSYPTSTEELDAWYAHVPDAENAALGFLAAEKAGVQDDDELLPAMCTGESCPRLNLSDAQILARSEALVAKNSKALELAHAAARLESSRYPIDLSVWPLAPDYFDQNKAVTWVARLIILEAAISAQKGDAERATGALVAGFACARSLSGTPILFSQMSALSIYRRVEEEAVETFGRVSLSMAQLDRVSSAVRELRASISLPRALAGESVFGLFSDSPANPLSWPTLKYDRIQFGELVHTLLVAADAPMAEGLPVFESIENEEHERPANDSSPMTNMMTPAFSRLCSGLTKGVVRLEMFNLVVGIEKYRLARGSSPTVLAELVPEFVAAVPRDPFGTGPYRYLRDDKGYAVYSVGYDRRDDGGATMKEKRLGDMVFRVTH
jgi:hypothetical protein